MNSCEFTLRYVECYPIIIQIGNRDHRPLRAVFCPAGELRGYQFTFFRGAFENGPGYWSTNHGGIELRLGERQLTLRLEQRTFGSRNFFGTGPDLNQL